MKISESNELHINNSNANDYIFYCIVWFHREKNVFDLFLKGAEDGLKMVIALFPTLLGIFIAVGLLRNSGILSAIINVIGPITNLFKFPIEIMPLAILRPVQ